MKVTVSEGYPVWIEIEFGEPGFPGSGSVKLRHTDLLTLELMLKSAKRDCLINLPRDRWHELDPDYVT